MRMKNADVIEKFVLGVGDGVTNHGQSLRIEGDKLFNYDTVIGQWYSGILVVNATKYSATTSKLQNMLRREVSYRNVNTEDTVDRVPMGASDIIRYSYASIL